MSCPKEVFVIGHKNPDTDSICSAIAYAYLKNQMGDGRTYVPKRAGAVSSETEFVLQKFGHEAPEYIENVRIQVQDVAIQEGVRVSRKLSVKRSWEILASQHKSTLVISGRSGGIKGLITIGDIAKSIMDVHSGDVLAKSRTPYANIMDTLEGEILVGDVSACVEKGKVIIAAANPDILEESIEPGDMVIMGDRYETQLCALEMNAGCLVICMNSEVNPNIIKMAEEKGCVIIRTPYDTFIAARLLNQSIPIDYFMISSGIQYFRTNNYIEEIRGIMANLRHREFPVLDDEGKFVGMLTRHSLLEVDKKKVILVDHNEVAQAVDGLQEAEIEELLDHHKIGYVETIKPILFRNQPVGCTSTIIYMICVENGLEIPKDIAGLMCSAIISDTLLFRSPTCTPVDIIAAEDLARMAGIELESYAKEMFTAGSNLGEKTEAEILNQDFKKFQTGALSYGIGQITSMDGGQLDEIVPKMTAFMEKTRAEQGLDMIFLMLTDILSESTSLICVGEKALEKVADFSGCKIKDNGTLDMPGVVSRKKQIVPLMVQTFS